MKRLILACACAAALVTSGPGQRSTEPPQLLGFRDPAAQISIDKQFLGVPDPRMAEEELRVLTSAPHIAGSPEDKKTADYVAQKFREAGLETEIVEYRVWFNYPAEISVDMVAPPGVKMHGPSRERVNGDAFQNDPRIVMPYAGYSPSGDVEAEVVYANYGRQEDFKRLEQMKVDVRGKIAIVRYGGNYRGVKAYVAQQFGVAGLLLYSDPLEDGFFKGDPYPKGPWRPATSVQRGSIGYTFQFPGDATTPGIASTPDLPQSQRTPPQQSTVMPKVLTTPLSWADAEPILKHLGGQESPRDWQGALPFTYHVGPGLARVRMHLKQDYAYRTIWDVIGRVPGSEHPDEWVVAGNHRDAWVYGAVDPGSGTVAMLEAVRGIGQLLKKGWRPKRTIVFGSWDAEEHGLMGSTEWVEQNAPALEHAVAYLNLDSAVSGPHFGASAVPSLKQFMRDVAKWVPSPTGGTVYQAWLEAGEKPVAVDQTGGRIPIVQLKQDAPVGDLGSGSDFTPFFQHLGIPSTDMGSNGSYGVYHSAFDDFAWFKRFADPDFAYEQEMARIFGLEILHLADADILPFDYESYGKEITAYLEAARDRAETAFGKKGVSFAPALEAAARFTRAGAAISAAQPTAPEERQGINRALRDTERALLLPDGLPGRPWYRHAIYAPGRYAGYAAAVIPGVNEAISDGDRRVAEQQLGALTEVLGRAADILERHR